MAQPKENGTFVRLLTSLATALPLRQAGPPKLGDNPVSDYMCVALAADSTHTQFKFSVLTRQAGSEHRSVCSAAL